MTDRQRPALPARQHTDGDVCLLVVGHDQMGVGEAWIACDAADAVTAGDME